MSVLRVLTVGKEPSEDGWKECRIQKNKKEAPVPRRALETQLEPKRRASRAPTLLCWDGMGRGRSKTGKERSFKDGRRFIPPWNVFDYSVSSICFSRQTLLDKNVTRKLKENITKSTLLHFLNKPRL